MNSPRAPRLLIALALAAAGLVPSSARSEGEPNDGARVLVRFRPGTSDGERSRAHAEKKTKKESRLDPIDVEVVRIERGDTVADAVARYRRDPRVEFAEPNGIYTIDVAPDDTYFPGNGSTADLWGLQNTGQSGGVADADIDAAEAWDILSLSGSPWPTAGYTVGVVDTGVQTTHPDLLANVITPCYKAVAGDGTLEAGCEDGHGHGTHVSGTIAATGNNGTGVVGAAPNARVYMCKGLSDGGYGYDADIASCINHLVSVRDAYNLRVISLSLGGGGSDTLQASVDNALANGVLVLAAAGNNGSSRVSYPAGYASVVSVGSTTREDRRSSFSNYNADVELSAPGSSITSTYKGGAYAVMSGTSMAAPHAAAVAAVLGWVRDLRGTALRSALASAVDDLGLSGRDVEFGYGRVNLCLAVGGACPYTGRVVEPTPTPSPAPTPTITPGPAAEGSVRGTARYRGVLRPGVRVYYSGPERGSVYTGSDATYALSLVPGRYRLYARFGGRSCRANSATGSRYLYQTITAGSVTTIDWYC